MRNFKNNFRRNRYKNHTERNSLKNDNGGKIINNLQNGSNFIRKNSGRNNHNAPNLIEKYSSLAREALSNGDKILSENYYQHAEHFIRVLGDKDSIINKNQISKEKIKIESELIEEKNDQNQKKINSFDAEKSEQLATTENWLIQILKHSI